MLKRWCIHLHIGLSFSIDINIPNGNLNCSWNVMICNIYCVAFFWIIKITITLVNSISSNLRFVIVMNGFLWIFLKKTYKTVYAIINVSPQPDIRFQSSGCYTICMHFNYVAIAFQKQTAKKRNTSWHRCLIRKNVVNFVLNHFFVHSLALVCVLFFCSCYCRCLSFHHSNEN